MQATALPIDTAAWGGQKARGMTSAQSEQERHPMTAPSSVVRLEDHRPPQWLVDTVHLDFDLHPERTIV